MCAQCHLDGDNSPIARPSPPAPAGTAPGCLNSTLCHGASPVPHPVGGAWVTVSPPQPHGDEAKDAPGRTTGFAYCQICHGSGMDFAGGSSGRDCYECHEVSAPHPSSWRTGDTYFHTTVAGGNASVCAFCHTGGENSPVPAPSPPAPGGTPPGCFNSTLCHGGVVAHPVPFLDPAHLGVDQAEFNSNCANCHAVSGTSPVASAPVCFSCHTAGSPLTLPVCTSCHDAPPAGAVYPNVSGAHTVHVGLNNGAGTPVSCDTCHIGIGSGTQEHYDQAKAQSPPGDVAFVSTYDALSGSSSFDNAALACTNVSCHGGKTTPDWRIGTLDVNTQCASCHAFGTGQFNSYSSGRHDLHVNSQGFSCLVCHNSTSLAVSHFTALGTPTMEGPASATIGGGVTAVSSYVAPTCIALCHPSGENWQ